VPKKLDPKALLRGLKHSGPAELKPLSTRVSVRCLRFLLERCDRAKLDLASVVRQILEEHAAAEPAEGKAATGLTPEARQVLTAAIDRVRRAYQDGRSPIDAILEPPLRADPLGGPDYHGPLATLIEAAIRAVSVQEVLDSRTLAMIAEQRQHQHETDAERLWRLAVERAPLHVRPEVNNLMELERSFRARLKLAWRPGPDDDDPGPPPLVWRFDESVLQDLARPAPAEEAIQSVQKLIRGGYLLPEGSSKNQFRWDE
jgi:hypothetical protein